MWVMSSKRFPGNDGDAPHVDFCIGQVKIAEIVMNKRAVKWKFFLRLMLNSAAYDIRDEYETFGDALKDLHRLLKSPPPEGFETGVPRKKI